MNVLEVLTAVMRMELVITLQEITHAFATLDTQAMASYASVRLSISNLTRSRQPNFPIHTFR